jgi:hypothetical protein
MVEAETGECVQGESAYVPGQSEVALVAQDLLS